MWKGRVCNYMHETIIHSAQPQRQTVQKEPFKPIWQITPCLRHISAPLMSLIYFNAKSAADFCSSSTDLTASASSINLHILSHYKRLSVA